jgi:hypothetical protein
MSIFNKMLSVSGAGGGIVGYVREGLTSLFFKTPYEQQSTLGVTSTGECSVSILSGSIGILDADFSPIKAGSPFYGSGVYLTVDPYDNVIAAEDGGNKIDAWSGVNGTFKKGSQASDTYFNNGLRPQGVYTGDYFYNSDLYPQGTIMAHKKSDGTYRGLRNYENYSKGLGCSVQDSSYTKVYGATATDYRLSLMQLNTDFTNITKSRAVDYFGSGNASYLGNPRNTAGAPLIHPTDEDIVFIVSGNSLFKFDFSVSTPTVEGWVSWMTGQYHTSKMGKDGYLYASWEDSSSSQNINVIKIDPDTRAYTKWVITHSNINYGTSVDVDADANGVIYVVGQIRTNASNWCAFLLKAAEDDFVSVVNAISGAMSDSISVTKTTGNLTSTSITSTSISGHSSAYNVSQGQVESALSDSTTFLNAFTQV